MSPLIGAIAQGLHLLLVLAAAPLVLGLQRRAGARLAGRPGPAILQEWRDLLRLLRKQSVLADAAGPVSAVAPALVFAATVLAAALVPGFARGMAGAGAADLILIAGLLMLAGAAKSLAAMEAGVAKGGVGASRAMARAAFTMPALVLAILPLGLLAGTTNLDTMAGVLREGTLGLRVPLVLAVAALGVVALALAEDEAGLADEFAARDLALLRWAEGVRRVLWLSLLADLAVPFGLIDATGSPAWWPVGIAVWVLKLAVLTLALALWQAGTAARPTRLWETLGLALLLGGLAALFLFAAQGLA